MTLGDIVSLVASKVVFPTVSRFSSHPVDDENSALRVYTSPFGQKILYRPRSLDRMVLWEQWGASDYQTITVKEGDVVVELGGHIGTSTLNYSHLVGPTGAVYSIEALPENFAILKRNLESNRVTNVKAFDLAIVGDESVHASAPRARIRNARISQLHLAISELAHGHYLRTAKAHICDSRVAVE